MKFRITKNAWTSGKNKLQTDAELKQFSAYSYDWWQYVATDAVGNVYFNNSKYSNTTSGHQGETLGILRSVGIRVDFEVGSTLEHFGRGIDSVLQAEIKELQKKNADLKTSIDTPRSHKRKNAERRETIKANEYRIKDIERILTEYLDKKRIPQPKLKPIEALITALELDNGTAWYETERQNDLNNLEIYKQYFKKPNGTVQINELTALINRVTRRWGGIQNAPAINQIDTLRELLSLKPSESIEFLLIYPHTKDIPGMLISGSS